MCEVTGMILMSLWFIVVLFHKHRFILMRRFFSISGTIFMLRCVTMLITSLSVPGTHLECQPRPYGDIWNKLHNAYIIWTGMIFFFGLCGFFWRFWDWNFHQGLNKLKFIIKKTILHMDPDREQHYKQ